MPRPGSVPHVLAGVFAFLSELAMVATLGVAGWHFGGGGLLSVAVGALCPAIAVWIWSVWCAPKAQRRLADPLRLVLQIMLFLATAVVSARAGRLVLGVIVAAVGIAAFVAARLTDRGHGPTGRHAAGHGR